MSTPDDAIVVTGSAAVAGAPGPPPTPRPPTAEPVGAATRRSRTRPVGRRELSLGRGGGLASPPWIAHWSSASPTPSNAGLVGEIIGRFERRGLTLVAAELRTIDAELAGRHYAEHEGKPFYDELVSFISRSPALVLVVEGPEDTWKVVRTMMGTTNPREAAPGTIRGDLGILFTENLVHGSDSPSRPPREIALFFPTL